MQETLWIGSGSLISEVMRLNWTCLDPWIRILLCGCFAAARSGKLDRVTDMLKKIVMPSVCKLKLGDSWTSETKIPGKNPHQLKPGSGIIPGKSLSSCLSPQIWISELLKIFGGI